MAWFNRKRSRGKNWRPKMVALDIDGTVVDHAGFLPDPVRQAVQRALDQDVRVVLATGRSWHGTAPIHDALGLPPGQLICSNGSVRASYPPFSIDKLITFDPREVITTVLREVPQAAIAVEEVGVGYRLNRHFPDGELTGEMKLQSIDELSAEPVSRVIIRDPEATDSDFISLAESLGMHGVEYFIGYSAWLDIAPEGVSKATALADVCELYDIEPTDVLALGDGRNDIEMLEFVGRGVAIGDADETVKAAADAVTGRFGDGGTVTELDRWFA